MKRKLNRREFIKLSGAAAAGALLAGCAPASPPATQFAASSTAPVDVPASPFFTQTPTDTATPAAIPPAEVTGEPATTATPLPSPTPAGGRPAILRFYPDTPSRVVKTSHPGAWTGNKLDSKTLQAMVDATITRLTGLDTPQAAWQALFRPSERIAIKVNAFSGCRWWTHPALVQVVTGSLVAAGIPAENILIYDQETSELQTAGFKINKNGSGVRCQGSEKQYTTKIKFAGVEESLSDLLLSCDALINMPLLKQHGMAGISFAMKNHFGTVNNPAALHGDSHIPHSIAELNALEPIRTRTRLVIGDALETVLGNSWTIAVKGTTIFMSYDPVAHDAAGLQHFGSVLEKRGDDPTARNSLTEQWLSLANGLGLGTHEMKNIELLELNL